MQTTPSTLANVAATFRASLSVGAMVAVFRIDALDRIGMPVVQAALIQADGESVMGYGYGASETEASVGALGELCEEVRAGAFVAGAAIERASHAELARRLGPTAVADPLTLCLPAGSPYDPDMILSWVEGHRLGHDGPVMVPLDWVAAYASQLSNPPDLITPITNGLGAGLDLAHAIAHGVMELLQRDGNVTSYRALDQGVVIALDDVRDPEVPALIERLRGLGIDVTVKLATTEFGLTNLYVVGDDRGTPLVPIQITACGEACHPDRERALRKALLEFIGSRARKAATHGPIDALRAVMPTDYAERQIACAMVEPEEPRALRGMADWIASDASVLRGLLSNSVFAHRSDVPFSSLPTTAADATTDAADRLQLLAQRLAREQLEILFVDCSAPGSPVNVTKAIVPGLESETMSYRRIGWRGVQRLRARRDQLILDAPRVGALRVRLRPQDEARAGGPAWFDAELADRLAEPIYPLYREPGPFSAQLLRDGKRSA